MIRLTIAILFFQIGISQFTARVIGVTDGDTIVVLDENNKQTKIRLEGIDCPESGQDFGSRAKQATVDLCFQKNVIVKQTGTDRYNRILAFVYVDDLCINKELLRIGMAWHFKQYNKDQELANIENEARNSGIGLWSVHDPTPPWEWRRK